MSEHQTLRLRRLGESKPFKFNSFSAGRERIRQSDGGPEVLPRCSTASSAAKRDVQHNHLRQNVTCSTASAPSQFLNTAGRLLMCWRAVVDPLYWAHAGVRR